jgi:hypothetical protein
MPPKKKNGKGKKTQSKPSFIEKVGQRVEKVGQRVVDFLDSQKDAISRATRELKQTQGKLERKEEERRTHRLQCDDYVHQRSCPKCDSLAEEIKYLRLTIFNLDSGLRRAKEDE